MTITSSWLAIVHFPLVAGGLLAAMFYPPEDSPTVLINPTQDTAVEAIEWARSHEAAMLGLSANGRSPIIRLSGDANALAALSAGFIPIAADLALCGARTNNRGLTQ